MDAYGNDVRSRAGVESFSGVPVSKGAQTRTGRSRERGSITLAIGQGMEVTRLRDAGSELPDPH
jgi:hypothetical protein